MCIHIYRKTFACMHRNAHALYAQTNYIYFFMTLAHTYMYINIYIYVYSHVTYILKLSMDDLKQLSIPRREQ